MEMMTITIPFDKVTARIYNNKSEEEKRKIQFLLGPFFKDFILSPRPLEEIMDEVSAEAEKRGVTPEILDSILSEEF